MNFKYDYYISYGCFSKALADLLDPEFVKKYNSFVDEFVLKLENNPEFQNAFGRKARVFCYKSLPESIYDWNKTIYPEMASSRCMIVFLSPYYFWSTICFHEFHQWLEHEAYTGLMGESVIPMYMMEYSPNKCNFIKDVSRELIRNYDSFASNWVDYLKKLSPGENVDMHDFQTSRIDVALNYLITTSIKRFEKQNKCNNCPFNNGYPQMNDHFISQLDTLYSLRRSFTESESKPPVLLYGLDGVGKTETALAYGSAYGWDYELGRIFIPCENNTSFSSVILSSGIAELFGWELPTGTEDEQLAFLLQQLQKKHDKFLLENSSPVKTDSPSYGANMLFILDNVNQPELASKKNLERLPDFIHVIATSTRASNQFNHFQKLPVNPLEIINSLGLLKSYRLFSEEEAPIAQRLAEHFNGFPALLVQTGLYLQSNNQLSYVNFYEDLHNNYTNCLQDIAKHAQDVGYKSARSIQDLIESAYNNLSPNAQMFLEFAGLFSPDAIPVSWIRVFWGIDDKQFEDVIEELKEYNIISINEKEPHLGKINKLVVHFKIHKDEKLVRDAVPQLFERSLKLIHSTWDTDENLWELDAVYGVYDTYSNLIQDIQIWQDMMLPDLFIRIGQIYKDLKIYDKARLVFIKNMGVCQKILRALPDDLKTKQFLSCSFERLGNIEDEDRVGDKAIVKQWYEKALKIDESLAAVLPDDLSAQVNLTTIYVKMSRVEMVLGNQEKSFEFCQKALNLANRLENIFHPVNEQVLSILSLVYGHYADLERDKGLYNNARQLYLKTSGFDERLAMLYPNSYKHLNNLATIYDRIGTLETMEYNVSQAVEWYKKALSIRDYIAKGMSNILFVHQQLKDAFDSLANAELKVGDIYNAEIHFENKTAILNYLNKCNPEDVSFKIESGYTNLTLGDINHDNGKFPMAHLFYQKAFDDFEIVLSIQSDNLNASFGQCITFSKTGDLAVHAGALKDAIQCYQNGIDACCQILETDPDNDDVLHLNSQLLTKTGKLCFTNADYTNANMYITNAISIRENLVRKFSDNKALREELETCRSFIKDIDKKQNPSKGFFGRLFDKFFGK